MREKEAILGEKSSEIIWQEKFPAHYKSPRIALKSMFILQFCKCTGNNLHHGWMNIRVKIFRYNA